MVTVYTNFSGKTSRGDENPAKAPLVGSRDFPPADPDRLRGPCHRPMRCSSEQAGLCDLYVRRSGFRSAIAADYA
jgi:hypothetical protein